MLGNDYKLNITSLTFQEDKRQVVLGCGLYFPKPFSFTNIKKGML